MTTTTGAAWFFCAAHRAELSGKFHGHTWEVEAEWPGELNMDAEDAQAILRRFLEHLDHSVLPLTITRAEDLAKYVGQELACVEVWVGRRPERLFARWRRDP